MGFGGAEGFHNDQNSGGTIGGGGTLNYIAKFTPDGTHIGDSLLFDNGVSIGFGTAAPDASATFDIDSTTQGFLVPRMTAVQKNAIVGPATSLLVFDTSAGLFSYFDGAVWQYLDSTATSEWLLDGNTNGALKYIGTNDAFDFPVYTNGVEVFRATTSGNVAIGNTTAVSRRLLVKGATTDSTAFGIDVTDSLNNSLFKIRNDGRLIFNDSSLTMPDAGTASVALKSGAYNWFLYTNETFLTDGTVSYHEIIGANFGASGTFSNHEYRLYTNNTAKAYLTTAGDFGIAEASPTARLHVAGSTSDSTAYAAKFDNSVGTGLLYVRNDGFIGAGNTGNNSMTIGFNSGFDSTLVNNTFIGVGIGSLITTANRNTALGSNALNQLVDGARNTVVGESAGSAITSGFGHTIIGRAAASTISGGQYITSVGYNSLVSSTVGENTAVGASSGGQATTAAGLALFGYQAWEFGTTGNYISAFGYNALRRNVTGQRTVAMGMSAGEFNVAAGSDNVYIGYQAGYFNNDTGTGGGTVGQNQNVLIGSNVAQAYTGSGSVIIGYQANMTSIPTDNILYIHNSDTSTPLVFGDFANIFFGINTSTPYLTGSLFDARRDQDDITNASVVNQSAGTAAQAQFTAEVNGSDMLMIAYGANHAAYAGQGWLQSSNQLHVIGNPTAVGESALVFHTQSTSTEATEEVIGDEVTTTDGTTATVLTINIPTDTMVGLEAYITSRKTNVGGTGTQGDGGFYIRTQGFKNVGGTVTTVGALQSSYTGEDNGGFNATLDISGTTVRVRVTGAAGTDINWSAVAKLYKRT